MSGQTPQRKINLRKYSRPRLLRNPASPANDPETSQPPSPTPNAATPTTPPPSPTHLSTAANFKQIYTNTSNSASFSGDIHKIANQIKSYRLARRFSPY